MFGPCSAFRLNDRVLIEGLKLIGVKTGARQQAARSA
jgi:hypothetical protein